MFALNLLSHYLHTKYLNGRCNFCQEEKARVVQTILFVAGINTLFQTFFGTRLPVVMGGSYTFVAPTISIILAGRYSNEADPREVPHSGCVLFITLISISLDLDTSFLKIVDKLLLLTRRNSCGQWGERRGLLLSHRRFRSYLVSVGSGAMFLSRCYFFPCQQFWERHVSFCSIVC